EGRGRARGGGIVNVLRRHLLAIIAMLGGIHSAHAHGIAGNRFFPGTLSFDDPAVADEAIVPNFSSFKRPGDAGNIVDNRFDWAFFVFLRRPSELALTERGFTGTGAVLCGRDLK